MAPFTTNVLIAVVLPLRRMKHPSRKKRNRTEFWVYWGRKRAQRLIIRWMCLCRMSLRLRRNPSGNHRQKKNLLHLV